MAREETRMNEKANQPGQQEQGKLERVSRTGQHSMLSPTEFFRMGPFSLMKRMNEEMARMFGEITGAGTHGAFAPPIEVTERDGKCLVRAELPGVNAKDIDLKVTENAVVIEGEHQAQREENEGGVHVSERRYGRFYRAIPLPEGANTEQVSANFDNGILEIEIPVTRQETAAREIPIRCGGNQTGPKDRAA